MFTMSSLLCLNLLGLALHDWHIMAYTAIVSVHAAVQCSVYAMAAGS